MKLEKLKSILLFILVSTSLLLTLAIWTYQPEYEELDPPTYLEENELEGEKHEIHSILRPKQIIFNNFRTYSMLPDKQLEMDFYEELTEWSFSHIEPYPTSDLTSIWSRNMEVIFPVEIPMKMIDRIFNVDEFDYSWNHTFDRVYFQLAQGSEEHVRATFASKNSDQVLHGELISSEAYSAIHDYIYSPETISAERLELDEEDYIYLPAEEIEVPEHTILTDHIDQQPLINVLFSNPSLVRQQNASSGLNRDRYYTDGTRALRTLDIFHDNHYLMFVNPLSVDSTEMEIEDLIRRSVEFTNDHSGWTDDFQLDHIEQETNTLSYRMHYEGLPIFDANGHWVMEQTWYENDLQAFSRPLFKVSTPFQSEGETKRLSSGLSIYHYFQNSQQELSLSLVEDVKIGYEVRTGNDVSNVVFLEPTWYVKYAGTWRPLSYFEDRLTIQEDG
ncbi:YycH family regulatory protein [Alkalibacillus aidingensis]|uniref:YycH family regulatory protein n=1 Tax=Alkalibacillus aidingensis TaxID=2747607 RepID=UPI0016610A33|nr:two-component system activity regulator YycH [Alkalibacillus aidingensis]